MEFPYCSIIVLNYQGEKIIEKTLNSLTALNYKKDRYEVLIVENGSKDKSDEVIGNWLAAHKLKNFHLLSLPKNLGFAGGNNEGIKRARGKYIALLNNDCVVDKNWLRELVIVAEKNEKIFAVNSKIMLGETNKIQNAGILLFKNGYARDIGAIPKNNKQEYEEDHGQYEMEREIDAACAAAVLYRTSVLQEIGLLDESFFLYYEDVELSERARVHGYKIVYAPKASVRHIHAASSEEGSPFFVFHSEKGRLLHMIYHASLLHFFFEYIQFGIKALLRLGYGLRHTNRFSQQKQYLNVFISLLTSLPVYFKKRHQFTIPLQFHVAYEISPLLAKTGKNGEKSGLYRLLFSTIQNMSNHIQRNRLTSIIYLFSYYPSLLDDLPQDLKQLLYSKNIQLISIVPYTFSFPLSLIRTSVRFIFRHTGNTYSQEDYKKRLIKSLKEKNIQVIHHSETCFFEAPGFTNVITINDLVPIKFPEWCQPKTIINMRKKLEFAKNHCQGIVCISENTKKDLANYWGTLDQNKNIEVIYPSTFPLTTTDQLLITNDYPLIANHYFLAYGTYEPRKNLIMLVRAFSHLYDENKLQGYKLVLVGGKGWGNVYEDIRSYVHKKYKDSIKSPIEQLGYQTDDVLLSLIKNAKAVVYPTLYEGYGYPIIESQQLGVPIITSTNSSLPEACNGKCIVTSNDVMGWKDAILNVINTDTIPQKKIKFDSKIIAEETYAFYRTLHI